MIGVRDGFCPPCPSILGEDDACFRLPIGSTGCVVS